MCRNIKTLNNFEPPATDDEIKAAALQFVRKISGFNKPSQKNAEAFEKAVEEIFSVSRNLLENLVSTGAPRDREIERAKMMERNRKRFERA
ncbi:MAG: DUF2277 domain-containing protein [Pyrinomonadaceae bacterium]|nr:DUF2277 domain-containing protein [Pyrinomonadaceae bacterium]